MQETLERKRQEGIHKAVYSLLTWLLDREARVIQAFWSNLSKEYNQERYPKLQPLLRQGKTGLGILERESRLLWKSGMNEPACRQTERV